MSDQDEKNKTYCFEIDTQTRFLEHQSDVENQHHVFAYTITIKNTGTIGARPVSYTHLTLPTIYSV